MDSAILTIETFRQAREFWIENLGNGLTPLDLPYDIQQKNKCRIDYGVEFPVPLSAKLAEITGKRPLGIFTIILSALQFLLSCYLSRDRIVIASPVLDNGTDTEGFNSLILFAQNIDYALTFREFLDLVKTNVAACYKNQHYPLEKVLDHLGLSEYFSGFTNIVLCSGAVHEKKQIQAIEFSPDHELVFSINQAGQIPITISFRRDLFDPRTIGQIAEGLLHVLAAFVADPSLRLSSADPVPEQTKRMILDRFNNSIIPCSPPGLLHELFTDQAAKTPDAVALEYHGKHSSYGEINCRSSRLAGFLFAKGLYRADLPTGILLDDPVLQVSAVLGILKSGCAYLPLDSSLPYPRLCEICGDSGLRMIISEKKFIRHLNKLQWECESLRGFICLDSGDIHNETENENRLMDSHLWEYIGNTAKNEIEGGGWINSFTGEYFSQAEMNEYGENIRLKLAPYLCGESSILEIGCASGITMFRLAPSVKSYYGTDLSKTIIEKNSRKIKDSGITNITLETLAAHEIDTLESGEFDIVILNSVVQCFSGHNYFRQVIKKAIALLKEKGIIFIGDIMDQDRKARLIEDLKRAKTENPGARIRTDPEEELFLSRDFLSDLRNGIDGIEDISFSQKIHTIANELTEYRFDALLFINKNKSREKRAGKKEQWDESVLHDLPDHFTNPAVTPDHLAYIIYTSGTTGTPKGVMIEHRSIVEKIKWRAKEYALSEKDSVLQLFNYSFDGYLTSLFTPLACGAKAVLTDNQKRSDTAYLKDLIRESKITHFIAIPSFYSFLLDEVTQTDFTTMRIVTLAGDRLTPEVVEKSKRINPALEIINEYGPTETSVVATFARDMETGRKITIGHPVSGTGVYILNEREKLLPPGFAGELCVRGCLARGYVNKPDITGSMFRNIAIDGENIRLYKTGDLARFAHDGNLEFLGRKDSQVKIRGFRIEPGEIIRWLNAFPSIRRPLVMDWEDHTRTKHLVCYFESDIDIDPQEIKTYLAQFVPPYMIPVYYVRLRLFPLTASGKPDLRKLPDPRNTRLLSHERYRAPESDLEKMVASIWQEVLDLDLVSIDSDFFDLGGDSLKVLGVRTRIREQGYDVSVEVMMRYRTIGEICHHITGMKKNDISLSSRTGEVKLLPMQIQFFSFNMTDMHFWNTAFMLYRKQGFDAALIKKVFDAIVLHHDELRISFRKHEAGIIQYYQDPGNFKYDLIVMDPADAENPESAIPVFAHRIYLSMNLFSGSLLKLGLFRTKTGDHLLVSLHHMISDAITLQIIGEDFERGYGQLLNNEEIRLLPKTTSLQELADYLYKQAAENAYQKDISYWERLATLMQRKIPVDHVIPVNKHKDRCILEEKVVMNKDETAFIKDNTEACLLTGLSFMLKEWTGFDYIIADKANFGRSGVSSSIDVSRTTGFLAYNFPICLDLTKTVSIRDCYRSVCEMLEQIPGSGLSYMVLNYISPLLQSDTSGRAMMPEIFFNYHGRIDRPPQSPLMEISPFSPGDTTGKETERIYKLYIDISMFKNVISVSFTFNKSEYELSTMKRLISGFSSYIHGVCTNIKPGNK